MHSVNRTQTVVVEATAAPIAGVELNTAHTWAALSKYTSDSLRQSSSLGMACSTSPGERDTRSSMMLYTCRACRWRPGWLKEQKKRMKEGVDRFGKSLFKTPTMPALTASRTSRLDYYGGAGRGRYAVCHALSLNTDCQCTKKTAYLLPWSAKAKPARMVHTSNAAHSSSRSSHSTEPCMWSHRSKSFSCSGASASFKYHPFYRCHPKGLCVLGVC